RDPGLLQSLRAGVAVRLQEPAPESFDTVLRRNDGIPAGHLGKTTMVRGEPGLVAQAKVAERQVHWTSAQSLRHADHLQQAERVGYATSDVECMSRELREFAAHSEQRSYEIVDVQHVPHLPAIAENRQWVVTERASEKVGNPALVAVRRSEERRVGKGGRP